MDDEDETRKDALETRRGRKRVGYTTAIVIYSTGSGEGKGRGVKGVREAEGRERRSRIGCRR